MIIENYYKSQQALALGQKGLLGGAIGTVISGYASGAAMVGITGVLIRNAPRGPAGLGPAVALSLAGLTGFIQGTARYPVHYALNGHLDTTAKKVMGLMLEFTASTFVFWLQGRDLFHHPFHAALVYSGVSFPCSILACIITGLALTGIGLALRHIGNALWDRLYCRDKKIDF